jgi:hypothetical protein
VTVGTGTLTVSTGVLTVGRGCSALAGAIISAEPYPALNTDAPMRNTLMFAPTSLAMISQ